MAEAGVPTKTGISNITVIHSVKCLLILTCNIADFDRNKTFEDGKCPVEKCKKAGRFDGYRTIEEIRLEMFLEVVLI